MSNRRFEIIEIRNGWLLQYYSAKGQQIHYFKELEEFYPLLATLLKESIPTAPQSGMDNY